jgi:hypothetical protein
MFVSMCLILCHAYLEEKASGSSHRALNVVRLDHELGVHVCKRLTLPAETGYKNL